jgi:folate-binding protein YgfZ
VDGVDVWLEVSEETGRVVDGIARGAAQWGGGTVDADAWDAARVRLGVPRAGVDFDEEMTPHEAGLDRRALSLSKGCYLGQERVARQQRRGDLSRRLVQIEIEGGQGVGAPAPVTGSSAEAVGKVTSVGAPIAPGASDVLALGQVKAPLAVVGERVRVDGRPARVRAIVGSVGLAEAIDAG